MNICLISTWPPMQCGIADFAYKITDAIPKADLNLHVITYAFPDINNGTPLERVTVYPVLKKNNPGSNLIKLLKTLKKISPQLIHLHLSTFLFPQSVLLAIFLYTHFSGKKLVLTIHDVIPRKPAMLSRYFLCYGLTAAASLCVLHSQYSSKELNMYYPGAKGKTTMIPHGLYHPGSTKAPGLPGQQDPDSLRYILFAGFIRESKGLEYLLEAFNRINHQHNVYLIIAGTVQEPQLNKDRQTYQKEMKYFQTLQSSTGKNDKIIYLNRFLPVEELNWLLLHAELVVFPYLDCSQSGMFHRALGYGKPIVASSVGNFAEVIENGVNGLLVSPKNSRELHHAIGNVLSDTDLGKQLKDSLAKNPIPGIEEISHRYYHLYQRVMEK